MIADGNLRLVYQLLHKQASLLAIEQRRLLNKQDPYAELEHLRSRTYERIKTKMTARFPNEEFLTPQEPAPKGDGYYWRIYPISETENFLRRSSKWTLAVTGHWQQRLHKGIIVEGSRTNYYWTRRSAGCYSKFERLRTSKKRDLNRLIFSCDMPYRVFLSCLEENAHRVFNSGSLLLNAADCAGGQTDVFIAKNNTPLIMLAALLLEETGGLVCDDKGGSFEASSQGIIAANNRLLGLLIKKQFARS